MKKTTTNLTLALAALGILTFVPQPASAAVSDEAFQKLQQQFQELQQEREQDRKEIDQLKQSLGKTQSAVVEAQKTASDAVVKAQQPVNPVPSEESSITRNFVISGSASALYNKQDGQKGSFLLGSFSPIFLFRASDDVLFESQIEFSLDNGETSTELEYAQMDYLANDYVTFIAGEFLLPLGQFPEKLHPTWVNKMPTMPLVYTGVGNLMHDTGIIPFKGLGVQARGATHINQSDAVLTYSAYVDNGPGSDDGTLSFEVGKDNNGVPSGGGRLAVFYPWSPYHDVEVGVSGQTGCWDNNNDLLWSALVGDFSMHLGPYTELRAEYVNTWQQTATQGTLNPAGAYVQLAYKLAGLQLDLPIINDCEVVGRYDYLNTDGEVTTARTLNQNGRANGYAIGMDYFLTNTLIVKAAYEFIDSNVPDNSNNLMTLQMTYGF